MSALDQATPALPPTTDDDRLAALLAKAAGSVLVVLRETAVLSEQGLGDVGDAIANELLIRALREARPQDAVLSEEVPDDGQRMKVRRVWIIDPLDGTREYRQGRDDFAVHVGLSIDGEATIGAVSLPALGRIYSTDSPPHATKGRERPTRIVVSRTRPPSFAQAVADAIGAKVVRMGSMGAKVIAVGQGVVDAYVHAGGHHEWDAAAPVAIARAAGLHVSHLDGTPVRFNTPSAYQEDLLVCRADLASALLEAIAANRMA